MGNNNHHETRLAIWDADGTLAWQTLYLYWLPAVHNICQEYGVSVPEQRMANHLAHDPYAAPEYGLVPDLAPEFGDKVRAEALRLAETYPIKPSLTLVRVLKQLQAADVLQGVATSANRPWANAVLKNLGLHEGVFAKVVTRDDVPRGKTKPDPMQLEHIMEHTGINPESTAMIGDSPSDVRAGHAAQVGKNLLFRPNGHNFFHVSTPALDSELLSLATHRVETFGDISRVLLNGNLR
jgi:phosphoglycolate phosphatase-like HAD superfamily hydrolase